MAFAVDAAAKKRREALLRALAAKADAQKRRDAIAAAYNNEFVVVRGRAGVQKSAGVARGGNVDEAARLTRLAELARAEEDIVKAFARVQKVRAEVLQVDEPSSSATIGTAATVGASLSAGSGSDDMDWD